MLSESKYQKNLSSVKNNKKSAKQEDQVITPELISELRSGSQEAFKTIYLHYYGRLQNFLNTLLKSKTESEEIAQDVFMTLWEKRSQLNPANSVKSFIYTIARNAALNLFDRRKVADKFSRSGAVDTVDGDNSEDMLIAQETEYLVKLVIERMPKMRRAIFELHYYENLDNAAIAERLGVSKTNVANHLVLSRKDIKDVIFLFILFMLM